MTSDVMKSKSDSLINRFALKDSLSYNLNILNNSKWLDQQVWWFCGFVTHVIDSYVKDWFNLIEYVGLCNFYTLLYKKNINASRKLLI